MVGIGRADRDLVKEKLIAHALTGHPVAEIEAIGRDFAQELIDTRLLPETVTRLEWHRSQKHRLVLVSATLDVYLQPLVTLLGFDDLLCTQLEIVDGRASGKLSGVNVRAAEKARQLRELIGDEEVDLWAYGNSSGDHAMLQMADHPFWIDRKGNVSRWQKT